MTSNEKKCTHPVGDGECRNTFVGEVGDCGEHRPMTAPTRPAPTRESIEEFFRCSDVADVRDCHVCRADPRVIAHLREAVELRALVEAGLPVEYFDGDWFCDSIDLLMPICVESLPALLAAIREQEEGE